MYSFKELRKAAKLEVEGNVIKVAVIGNCSTQFFSKAIEGFSKLEKLNINVLDADYNQIDAQLLDEYSEVFEFNPDNIILWLATEKLYEEFLDLPIEERNNFADSYIKKIMVYWNLVAQNSKARIIQPNFTEIDDKVLGNYSAKVDTSFTYQIRKLNFLLQEAMRENGNIYPLDLLSIQMKLGQERFFDAPLYYNAKMNIALDVLPYVAKAVTDILKSMAGKVKKCLVLDLDNTLWGGVIGDDGMSNIEIGELGRGHVFTNFQRWIKQLKQCGIILAVCSKNNEEVALEPFEKHEEMVLRKDDISLFIANWNDKATNIKMIQESLNIGMDSIVFVDDNPFERNLVRQMISDIEVPELPEDPALYLDYLQSCNFFDTVSFTGKNADRTKQYQTEFERTKLQHTFESLDDYLKSLEMMGEAKAFEPARFARIAQLTQRSNQFNLRTIRYTEDEIKRIAEDKDYVTIYYTLKDKFGDYGLVSVVILKKVSGKELFVDTWLMSCRVLKRGMEEFVVNQMILAAKDNGFEKIIGEYIPTKKNMMVKDIYQSMGFKQYDENKYCIDVKLYEEKSTFIKIGE